MALDYQEEGMDPPQRLPIILNTKPVLSAIFFPIRFLKHDRKDVLATIPIFGISVFPDLDLPC